MLKSEKPLKNYLILFGVCLLTFFVVIYVAKWYQAYSEYQKETPVIRGTLNYEITAMDFEHYMAENPNAIIYMCTSSSDSCRNFEKDFKKVINNKGLQDSIIYLNLSDANISEFVEEFNNRYNYKIKLTENYPALVEFTDGRVTALLEGTTDKILTISRVNQFIELHQVGVE